VLQNPFTSSISSLSPNALCRDPVLFRQMTVWCARHFFRDQALTETPLFLAFPQPSCFSLCPPWFSIRFRFSGLCIVSLVRYDDVRPLFRSLSLFPVNFGGSPLISSLRSRKTVLFFAITQALFAPEEPWSLVTRLSPTTFSRRCPVFDPVFVFMSTLNENDPTGGPPPFLCFRSPSQTFGHLCCPSVSLHLFSYASIDSSLLPPCRCTPCRGRAALRKSFCCRASRSAFRSDLVYFFPRCHFFPALPLVVLISGRVSVSRRAFFCSSSFPLLFAMSGF